MYLYYYNTIFSYVDLNTSPVTEIAHFPQYTIVII